MAHNVPYNAVGNTPCCCGACPDPELVPTLTLVVSGVNLCPDISLPNPNGTFTLTYGSDGSNRWVFQAENGIQYAVSCNTGSFGVGIILASDTYFIGGNTATNPTTVANELNFGFCGDEIVGYDGTAEISW